MVLAGRNLRARFITHPVPTLVSATLAIATFLLAGGLVITGFAFVFEGIAPSAAGVLYPASLVSNLWIVGGTMVWLGFQIGKAGIRLVSDLTEAPRQ